MAELDKSTLIKEEQKIVDELICTLEREIKDADDRLQHILWNYRKAKEQGPDAYGMIVEGIGAKAEVLNGIQRAKQSKDELYTCRIILQCDDGDGKTSDIELKIGLSTYIGSNKKILVCDWKRDVCRHFLLDNCAEEYDGVVTDKHGKKYETHYTLKMKRNVDTHFSHVRDVVHLYPLTAEEAQQIIFDAFLSELASRRDNTEFQNIIFSIQKKQGEIIKLPYDEDIIVQGCAGSGKSMIMLHRLPILIYDNPETLDSSNVYIISPFETYIQMVESMREELEITDLKMGTLNQYYDYVLSKYGINLDVYGRVSYATPVTREQEEYIYSKKLAGDIKKIAKQLIDKYSHNFSEGLTIFGLAKRQSTIPTIDATISDYILMGNSVINANNAVLKEYFNLCKTGINGLRDLSDKVKNRRSYLLRSIAKRISEQETLIKEKQKELEDKTLGEIAIKNRMDAIENARKVILGYTDVKEQVEKDDEYFEKFDECNVILSNVIEIFGGLKSQFEDNSREDIYKLLKLRKLIYKGYSEFADRISEIEAKYEEFAEDIMSYTNQYMKQMTDVLTKNDVYLDVESFEEILITTDYYTKLKENIAKNIYLSIMEKFGQVPNEKGEIKGLQFSPYLYLKIMFGIKGAPNAAKEKLICIDEAQGLAPEEMKLIRDINGEKLIFNLFGDVKQHIEGTKGIDSWNEFNESISVEEKYLMENYRNASQITEECNRRFSMKMVAINTPGSGVVKLESAEAFEDKMHRIMINVHKPGIRAIIVNDVEEAKQIKNKYIAYQDKIHDMTAGHFDFHRTRWNLLTVEQAKGLEFGTVIAISGRMTPNKKYIALTRALDELFIYDLPLEIEQIKTTELIKEDKKAENKQENRTRVKEEKKTPAIIDYSKSEVRKYFESKGLEINDMRARGGAFWVIGEQAKIKQFVDEACEKFGISGSYSSGKATGFRPGWYSKTKK